MIHGARENIKQQYCSMLVFQHIRGKEKLQEPVFGRMFFLKWHAPLKTTSEIFAKYRLRFLEKKMSLIFSKNLNTLGFPWAIYLLMKIRRGNSLHQTLMSLMSLSVVDKFLSHRNFFFWYNSSRTGTGHHETSVLSCFLTHCNFLSPFS